MVRRVSRSHPTVSPPSYAALRTTDVSGFDARAALLRDKPALRPYSALGAQVTVVFDGVVYRFDMR